MKKTLTFAGETNASNEEMNGIVSFRFNLNHDQIAHFKNLSDICANNALEAVRFSHPELEFHNTHINSDDPATYDDQLSEDTIELVRYPFIYVGKNHFWVEAYLNYAKEREECPFSFVGKENFSLETFPRFQNDIVYSPRIRLSELDELQDGKVCILID